MIAVIPEHILFSKDLSPQAKLLFAALSARVRAEDELSARFGVLKSTVQKWQRELEDAGLANADGEVSLDREPFVPVVLRKKKTRKQPPLDVVWGKEKFDEFISQVFAVYPRRKGRLVTKAETTEWIRLNVHENMTMPLLQAVKNYAASETARTGFACDPIRFFRNKRWLDFVGAPEKEEVRLKPVL